MVSYLSRLFTDIQIYYCVLESHKYDENNYKIGGYSYHVIYRFFKDGIQYNIPKFETIKNFGLLLHTILNDVDINVYKPNISCFVVYMEQNLFQIKRKSSNISNLAQNLQK
ncbi:hypothetical protein CDIK_0941 [Cucumispora dikerogammari]|nr:hypothetical protein CDIK_0941 [Cucumispora dikerogammari]